MVCIRTTLTTQALTNQGVTPTRLHIISAIRNTISVNQFLKLFNGRIHRGHHHTKHR